MYLSKFEMDIRSSSVRQALFNCEDMHRNVQSFFSASRKDSGTLYRVHKKKDSYSLYVLSKIPVDVQISDSRNGMKLIAARDITGFAEKIKEGTSFGFDLLAFPSKKITVEGRKNSIRIRLKTEEERMRWLERRAEQSGFLIEKANEERQESIRGKSHGNQINIQASRFTGRLVVTDENIFQQSWEQGFGPEKAYGLGLMILV